jgi:hypothetical protein
VVVVVVVDVLVEVVVVGLVGGAKTIEGITAFSPIAPSETCEKAVLVVTAAVMVLVAAGGAVRFCRVSKIAGTLLAAPVIAVGCVVDTSDVMREALRVRLPLRFFVSRV